MRYVQGDETVDASRRTEAFESGFGRRVRDARVRRGVTQQQLATALGVDSSAISRLENGARAVRLGEAVVISVILRTDIRELVYGPESHTEELARLLGEVRDIQHNLANLIESYLSALTKLRLRIERPQDYRGQDFAAVGLSDQAVEDMKRAIDPSSDEMRTFEHALTILYGNEDVAPKSLYRFSRRWTGKSEKTTDEESDA